MSISYHNVISDYKYTEYNIITLTHYNIIILIESYFFSSLNRFLIICNFNSFSQSLHQENVILGFRSNIIKLIIQTLLSCIVYKSNPVEHNF